VAALPSRRGEAHLIGSPFLLLDSLLVDVHRSVVGRGRVVISVGYVVGALVGLILDHGTTGGGREDGRWEYALKRGEHLGTTRLHRGTFKVVTVRSGRAIIGGVEMVANLRKRFRISHSHLNPNFSFTRLPRSSPRFVISPSRKCTGGNARKLVTAVYRVA
jgi:hypothetical protein